MKLFDFQERAVVRLLDFSTDSRSSQTIVLKAPTGAGKTILLIGYVDEYLDHVDSDVAFIWLCPGKGDLEEQSRRKMVKVAPQRKTQTLLEALQNGFEAESTTFINWELVTKRGNTALRDSEKKNLFDRIAEAHRAGRRFIIVIDEEHSNDTAKARGVIDAFSAKRIVRVSATANKNPKYDFYEIDERDVIDEGLITKAISVNEGLEAGTVVDDEHGLLLDLADAKRKAIAARYQAVLPEKKSIRPLVLIQFPNGRPETILAVEKKLAEMGYTYENGLVSKWMSEDKRELSDELTENDGVPIFLLMKQAISTGWDCPRAKILVKLREGMSESFTIQTIGRIRRMPEARHYDDELLDLCYVYTFDEEYKAGLLAEIDRAYESRRLFLKPKCKTFALEKELRDRDFAGLGGRDVLDRIYDFLVRKYHLDEERDSNKLRFSDGGYVFDASILEKVMQGRFVRMAVLAETEAAYGIRKRVDTHRDGMALLHCVDRMKNIVGLSSMEMKTVLERLFRKGRNSNKKILALDTEEFYAFIINNQHQLREELRAVSAKNVPMPLILQPQKSTFRLPEQDFFKYDPSVKEETDYLSNAYKEYTSGFATSLIRSQSEQLFERFCEEREDVDWVYKNGDTGQQYFSIVYLDGVQHQWLFYADYIVKKKDGTVWVIETKGGEAGGVDKNIDRQIENKFNAFKGYAAKHNLHWGFVRDKDGKLYLNNTEFDEDMNADSWRPIAAVFSE